MGFFFLVRSSEIRPIRHRDILLGMDNGRPFVTLLIRKSQTDQEKRGTLRTLYGVPSVLCPVKAAASFIAAKRGHYNDNDYLFSGNIAARIQKLMKLTAVTCELPEERFTRHSLRSGGSTSLFFPGVSLVDIRRFGRWMSLTYHEYLWFGDLQYRHLSTLMVNSASSTDQLRLAEDKSKGIKFTEPIYMAAEDMSHMTGGKAPLETRWRSRGSSHGPRSGDDFPDDAETNGPVVMNIADMAVAQHHPGSVAPEYLKRSTREGPARHGDINRSDEQ